MASFKATSRRLAPGAVFLGTIMLPPLTPILPTLYLGATLQSAYAYAMTRKRSSLYGLCVLIAAAISAIMARLLALGTAEDMLPLFESLAWLEPPTINQDPLQWILGSVAYVVLVFNSLVALQLVSVTKAKDESPKTPIPVRRTGSLKECAFSGLALGVVASCFAFGTVWHPSAGMMPPSRNDINAIKVAVESSHTPVSVVVQACEIDQVFPTLSATACTQSLATLSVPMQASTVAKIEFIDSAEATEVGENVNDTEVDGE